jgi:hypothetical protein
MGVECSTQGRNENPVQNLLSGNLKERDHAEDLSVDGKIILELYTGNRIGRCEVDASGSGQGLRVL